MTDIIAMQSAEPVIFGVVKIVWKDGFAGIVDLRPILAKGEMFDFLRVNPARFDDLKLEDIRRVTPRAAHLDVNGFHAGTIPLAVRAVPVAIEMLAVGQMQTRQI